MEYPDESTLKLIRDWDSHDFLGLVDFIGATWHWPDWGFRRNVLIDTVGLNTTEYWAVELDTGGWSGNEEIIQALTENQLFWTLCWEESRRGGHYKFKVRKK